MELAAVAESASAEWRQFAALLAEAYSLSAAVFAAVAASVECLQLAAAECCLLSVVVVVAVSAAS